GSRSRVPAQPARRARARWPAAGMRRSLVRRALEVRVAKPAVTASRNQRPLTRLLQIRDYGFLELVEYLRSRRYLDDAVFARRSRAVAAHSRCPVAGTEMLLIAIVDQRVQVCDALHPDVAAPSAIAAVGSAVFNEFLAPERNGAAAAISGLDVYFCLIEEFHGLCLYEKADERLTSVKLTNGFGEGPLERLRSIQSVAHCGNLGAAGFTPAFAMPRECKSELLDNAR